MADFVHSAFSAFSPTPARRWANVIRRWGAVIALWIAVSVGVVFRWSSGEQMILLLTGLCLVGGPHGIFDIDLALWAAPTPNRNLWIVGWLSLYISCIVIVMICWVSVPMATLIVFLCASIFHFGVDETAPNTETPSSAHRTLLNLSRGGCVIFTPLVFQPASVAPIFSLLAGDTLQAMKSTLAAVAFFNLLALSILLLIGILFLLKQNSYVKIFELFGVVLLFALTPPVFAFSIYFCGIHSIRHVVQMSSRSNSRSLVAHIVWTARRLVPISLILFIATFSACMLFNIQNANFNSTIFAWCFKVLAALTLPHLVMSPFLERRISLKRLNSTKLYARA